MNTFFDYVENHAWAQWVVLYVFAFAFVGLLEIVYPMIHGGETFHDAFAAWVGL